MKRPPAKLRRELFRVIGDDTLALRFDYPRRLRNALLCLAHSDPRWIPWVEENLPNDLTLCLHPWLLHMLESRARTVVLKAYRFHGRQHIGWLIFRHDWPFSDSGALTPG